MTDLEKAKQALAGLVGADFQSRAFKAVAALLAAERERCEKEIIKRTPPLG